MHSEAHIDAPTVTTSRTTSDVARSGMVQLRRWGLRDDVMSGAPPISPARCRCASRWTPPGPPNETVMTVTITAPAAPATRTTRVAFLAPTRANPNPNHTRSTDMHIIPTTPPRKTFPAYYLGRPVSVYHRRYRRTPTARHSESW